jgi:hypothetical protein
MVDEITRSCCGACSIWRSGNANMACEHTPTRARMRTAPPLKAFRVSPPYAGQREPDASHACLLVGRETSGITGGQTHT